MFDNNNNNIFNGMTSYEMIRHLYLTILLLSQNINKLFYLAVVHYTTVNISIKYFFLIIILCKLVFVQGKKMSEFLVSQVVGYLMDSVDDNLHKFYKKESRKLVN